MKYGRNDAEDGNKMRFHLVPLYPGERTPKRVTFDSVVKRQGKILHHREVMDRVGLSRECRKKNFICEDHSFEWVKKTCTLDWNGKRITKSYSMLVLEAQGNKSLTIDTDTASKGVA